MRLRNPMVAGLLLGVVAAGPAAAAQTSQTPGSASPRVRVPARGESTAESSAPVVVEQTNANELRERVERVLQTYPPGVIEILRIDPTLLDNAAYMAPYPGLVALVDGHPEIARNPRYFLGQPRLSGGGPDDRGDPGIQRMWVAREMFGSFLLLMGFLGAFSVIGWLGKMLVDHRRWLRASKLQSDVQGRILDRLTSNDELATFLQSAAGQRALESLTLPMDPKARMSTLAPTSRILWSIQVGTVVTSLGFGLLLLSATRTIRDSWANDMSPFFVMTGIVILAIGLGFLISAGTSYVLSRRLGLLAAPASADA